MSDVIEKYFEIAISIYAFVASTVFVVGLLALTSNPIIELGSDKTMVESTGIQQYHEAELYGHDILMTLLNTDAMAPYPRAIRINDTPVIKLTPEFVAKKMANIGIIYSSNGEYKLSTLLEHKIISKEYVYKGIDAPYIHYVLKEVK